MATVFRFVDTRSTAGGDGTTNATSGVNRAYVSLAEWESAEQADLVAAGDIHDVSCAGAADLFDVAVVGWTTGASNYILIHSTTDKHSGVFDASKYYFSGTDASGNNLTVSEEYVRIEDLQFDKLTPSAGGATRVMVGFTELGAGDLRINRNIFRYQSNDYDGSVNILAFNDSSPGYTVTNNLFDNRLVSGGTANVCIIGAGGSAAPKIYNNTFINWPTAITSKANYFCKNNIFQDCATDIGGTLNAGNDYNLTDNSSIAGANSVINSALTFADKAAFDFALASGDTDARGAGIGPSSDTTVPLDDIIGTARSGASTDIGAFVFVGGSGISLTVDSGTYSQAGNNTPLKAELNILTTSGSYLLTGSDVNLKAAKKLIAETGSYNLTGTDVTLTYTPGGGGEILVIDSGAYSLAGDELLLSAQLNIVSNSGNYLLSGTETRIAHNASIVTESSSYSLTGSNVNLFANYGMIVQSTSYTLTGTSVTLKYSGDTNQIIGTVTAGFAPDLYSVGYKPNTITVTFKE